MISKYIVYFFLLVIFSVQFSATEEVDTDLSDNPGKLTCEKWKPIEVNEFGQGRIEYTDEWNIAKVQCIPNTMTECTSVEIRGKQMNGKVITIKRTDGAIATVSVACKPSRNGTSIVEVLCHFVCEHLLNNDEDAGAVPDSVPKHMKNREDFMDYKTN